MDYIDDGPIMNSRIPRFPSHRVLRFIQAFAYQLCYVARRDVATELLGPTALRTLSEPGSFNRVYLQVQGNHNSTISVDASQTSKVCYTGLIYTKHGTKTMGIIQASTAPYMSQPFKLAQKTWFRVWGRVQGV